jgi:hypothetical protein
MFKEKLSLIHYKIILEHIKLVKQSDPDMPESLKAKLDNVVGELRDQREMKRNGRLPD